MELVWHSERLQVYRREIVVASYECLMDMVIAMAVVKVDR